MLPEQVLDKSGPLARVWIASHWERKISKSQFLQTNLEKTIDAITTTQDVPMALRVQGQLLLGVVRIYSRKTRYLLEDCNEALDKIKMAFKKGNVNMPDIQHTTASKKSITLPDRLTEFEVLMADEPLIEIDMDASDPILDSLSQMASSQDITLSDVSFAWDFHQNPMLDTEQGRALDEAENARVEDFDMESVEQGRRDAEGALDAMNTDIGEIDNPLAKGRYEDKNNMLDFDDFEFDDDFGHIAQPNAMEEEFQAPQSPDMVSSLNQSGLMRDEDFAMFDTAQLEAVQPPRRRRRRLVVDLVTEIPHDQLRQNVQDTSSIVDLNANIRKRGLATSKLDWKKPVACSPGTALNALYSRLSTRRRTAPTKTSLAAADDILGFDSPHRDEGAVGIDNGFDFDDFEVRTNNRCTPMMFLLSTKYIWLLVRRHTSSSSGSTRRSAAATGAARWRSRARKRYYDVHTK
ncbi:Rec8 like protein-domain-containing protein [Dichotomocladium elegans]|nr:Rec8 like protein-domain-containing protein [Dichotomocladium elegans]